MEICGIICEFNPFHNGHKYLIERAREITGCDYIVCIMSGDFTQRGEICILDKYTRAKHAVLGGADCVIELPAAFAVAPAEIFARGAVKMLSAIPQVTTLAFGCEDADKKAILSAAEITGGENELFKAVLNENLAHGESYAKSYSAAFAHVCGNAEIVKKPNNILAIEYAKAIKLLGANMDILPVQRLGSGYNDGNLRKNFSSAGAIRNNLSSTLVAANIPPFVAEDLKNVGNIVKNFEYAVKLILSRTDADSLKTVYGCAEGLENAIKSLENKTYGEILTKATSKRYPTSRIRRILTENYLKLYQSDCERFLRSDLYFSPLAVKKSCADSVLSAISGSGYPVITSGWEERKLIGAAKQCKDTDNFAHAQWQQIAEKTVGQKLVIV